MNYVYFIRADNAVKIGHTNNIDKRVSKFQTGNHNQIEVLLQIPISDIKKVHLLEKSFHRWFRTYHIQKEWFKYSNLMQSVIDAINEDGINCVATSLEISHIYFNGDGVIK